MARYAEVQDAELMYGAAQVAVICDRNLDGALDTSSFEMHLEMASAQMDMYLLGRYGLPLLYVPAYFKQACVDIAIANATLTADVATTEIGKRRDAALALMKLIAENKVKLPSSPLDGAAVNISHTPQTVAEVSAERELSAADGCLCVSRRINFGDLL